MKIRFAAMVAAAIDGTPVLAQDLHFPSLSYRTGPFAAGGIPFADGYSDYLTLMNERDGGIGGVKIRQTECETAYNTEKGVECYEAIKGDNPLVISPVHRHHLSADPQGHRRRHSAAHDGLWPHQRQERHGVQPCVQLSGQLLGWRVDRHQASAGLNGGNLSGKKVALVYHNSAYGKEPIRTLEELAKKHGYELSCCPSTAPVRNRNPSGCRSAATSRITC
jgi:branched-chain amino acid transport system substrate-binding protein